MTLKRIPELQVLDIENLHARHANMINMHKFTPLTCAQRWNAKRTRLNGQRGVKMAQFSIDDYVLYTEVWRTKRDKLLTRWSGPATVTGSSSY